MKLKYKHCYECCIFLKAEKRKLALYRKAVRGVVNDIDYLSPHKFTTKQIFNSINIRYKRLMKEKRS